MYHSITFQDLSGNSRNTWTDWHLIPSSRPVVAQAGVSSTFTEIPGRKDGPIDNSKLLTGKLQYSNRSGSFEFLVDNDHEYWETIRSKIVEFLHGKRMRVILEDDPDYYYEGRVSLNEWRSESWNSRVTIAYMLGAYKRHRTTGQKSL